MKTIAANEYHRASLVYDPEDYKEPFRPSPYPLAVVYSRPNGANIGVVCGLGQDGKWLPMGAEKNGQSVALPDRFSLNESALDALNRLL